jgi:hypothetical protein
MAAARHGYNCTKAERDDQFDSTIGRTELGPPKAAGDSQVYDAGPRQLILSDSSRLSSERG